MLVILEDTRTCLCVYIYFLVFWERIMYRDVNYFCKGTIRQLIQRKYTKGRIQVMQ